MAMLRVPTPGELSRADWNLSVSAQSAGTTRDAPQAICLVMGVVVTPEMTERPQEALFAEAARGDGGWAGGKGWLPEAKVDEVDYIDLDDFL